MYEILIANEQNIFEIHEATLRSAASLVLETEEIHAASLSIAIVDNAALRDLNRRHLEHDYDTDVLSFLLECDSPETSAEDSDEVPRGRGKRIEGEVIMSAEMASSRAAEFDWRPQEELTLYLVHGILHLAGYDDLTDSERELMQSRERAILARLNLDLHQ